MDRTGSVEARAREDEAAGTGPVRGLLRPVPLLVLALAIALGAQLALAASEARRAAELRETLSESHALANALERRIGYGGLIHEFKNYVLRPDEDGYRVAALEDAARALELVDRLEGGAAELGLEADLDDTREMIESYAARLVEVRELSAAGRGPGFVDRRVRFDDSRALFEVERLLEAIDRSVDARLVALARRGALQSALATAVTAALGLVCIGVVTRRQRRHAAAVQALVDELSAKNAELERANVSLSQFAGIVSHDLRTPIRHVELAGALIEEGAEDPETLEEGVSIVRRSAHRMDAIVNGLLDFTKTGFASPRAEELDACRFLETARAELAAEERAAGASLELDLRVEPGTGLLADPVLLTRVLSNLVGNSLKYARDGTRPRIVIGARYADAAPVAGARDRPPALELSVADDGIGIDPRFAERIFEPLERLHPADDRYGGVGIGLSLAKSIVEGHGGRIGLDTRYTEGTRMVLALPGSRVILPEQRREAA